MVLVPRRKKIHYKEARREGNNALTETSVVAKNAKKKKTSISMKKRNISCFKIKSNDCTNNILIFLKEDPL